ncbi:MAG TPA: hypothetical protein VF665_20720 [Longimicrobium sp.]|jgi:hypothetical protein|uniref:hypothetical protein n=1 Tax=Longimicrobium sp. TaxID=2029185 RepID=UPI002ED7CFAC
MIPIFRKLGTALAIVAALAVTGCADAGTPISARDGVPAFNTGANPDVNQLARFRTKPQVTIAWAKKWIGPEGGRLDFYGFAIEVPRGAVTKTTLFTIRLPVDPNGSEHVLAEFGPHNQQFNAPVAIELPYRGTTLEAAAAPTIGWWNDAWVDIGGTVTADGLRLRTLTNHFSTYGGMESSPRNGTLVVGGG